MQASEFSHDKLDVGRIVANEIGFPHDEVTSSSCLIEDLRLDRFDILELMDALESALLISIPDERISRFVTVGDIERFIRTTSDRPAAENPPMRRESRQWVRPARPAPRRPVHHTPSP